MVKEHSTTAPTRFIAANGITYAYRRLGEEAGVPLVFLQHFTGTMDNWDPILVDGFAGDRPVIIFDNAGVSRSTGTTPATVEQMAAHTLAFLEALKLTRVDLLGYSLGGFISQLIAAEHPGLVRRIILAGTAPEGGTGVSANLGPLVTQARKQSPKEPRLYLFFSQTETSQAAGRAFIKRQAQRTEDRDPDSTEQTVGAQFQAIVRWGSTDPGFARLKQIRHPVLVVNGKDDLMFPAINSYTLFQQLPDAKLILYPDSGHGSLFEFAESFVQEGLGFLRAES